MDRRPAAGGLCYGVKAIAEHLGVKPRQALRLVELKRIPHWREGRVICSTRAELSEWVGGVSCGRGPPAGPGRGGGSMTSAATDDVPPGMLRDRIGSGDRIGFAAGHKDPTGRPAFSIEWTGVAFVLRGPWGTHVGTFASWEATQDAAFSVPRRRDA